MTTTTEDRPTFTPEDLAEIDDPGAAAAEGNDGNAAGDNKAPAADAPTGDKPAEGKPASGKAGDKTIATGADSDADAKAAAEADDKTAASRAEQVKALRDQLAKHASAGDKKAYEKELKRLERLGIEKPEQIYGLWRELERWRDEGNLIKVPGKDAKPEEIAEFHKALGVPEKPEDYLKDLKLENGAVVGDADKPLLEGFAQTLHAAGAPPSVMKAALNWYYKSQEDAAAVVDEADDTYRRDSEKALKDELGAAFKRSINSTKSLFATAPGGADIENANGVYARIMGGRTADGKRIGDDPDVMRWLIGLAAEVNPVASVVEDSAGGIRSAEARLAEIEALRSTDRKKYLSKEIQDEELRLIEAIEKTKARG